VTVDLIKFHIYLFTCLLTLSVGRMIGLLMNNEVERIWKESAVAYYRGVSRHLAG
jgi:hypothetical protein